MGWTFEHQPTAHGCKGLSNKERKAVIDSQWNTNKTKVLKSSMVGSTYYGAVQRLDDNEVFAIIYKTSGPDQNSPYLNFGYKDMDETCGPCNCNCPKGILDLLTPTENETANAWRKRCYNEIETKHKSAWLKKLPLGSKVVWTDHKGDEHILVKHAPAYQFKTWFWFDENRHSYIKKSQVTAENTRIYKID